MVDSTKANKLARREALRVFGQGVLGAVIVSQGARAFAEEKKLICSDKGTIDGVSKMTRKSLAYVEASTKKDQQCSKCQLWKPPEKGEKCGGCQAFTGPVNPNGWCKSFILKKA